jgi:hypothetical protein
MNQHQKDLLRHEGFVHGFVAARDPKTPRATLLVRKSKLTKSWKRRPRPRKKPSGWRRKRRMPTTRLIQTMMKTGGRCSTRAITASPTMAMEPSAP